MPNVFKPSKPQWVIAKRTPMATEMKFDSGVIIALPETRLRGNNGLNQEYRVVEILAVADNMEGFEDITVGSKCILHELDGLSIGDDPNILTAPAAVIQALVEEVSV